MLKLLKPAVLVASLAWAIVIIARADFPAVWGELCHRTSGSQRGVLLALFFVPSALFQWLDTHGWRGVYGKSAGGMSFARLFSIWLAGEAVNQATPVLPLGGEPVKALLIRSQGLSGTEAAASILSARTAMILAQVLFTLGALSLALATAQSQAGRLSSLAVFPAVLGAGMALALSGVLLAPPQVRRGVGARLGTGRLRKLAAAAVSAVDGCRANPAGFAAALLWFAAGWAVVAGEFWLVAQVVGRPLSVLQALELEGMMNAVCMATFFIPGNLGSQEAGLLFVSGLFQSGSPLGAVMLILRRVREAAWIGAGLVCLAHLGGGGTVRRFMRGSRIGLAGEEAA